MQTRVNERAIKRVGEMEFEKDVEWVRKEGRVRRKKGGAREGHGGASSKALPCALHRALLPSFTDHALRRVGVPVCGGRPS